MIALATLALAPASDLVLQVGVRLAAAAVVLLLAALVNGWARLVPLAFGLLGGVYALYLSADEAALDGTAPAFAAGLLVALELAYWSLDERDEVRAEPDETLRRLGFVALLGAAALFVSGAVLALADVVQTRGLAVDVLGAAAAAAVLLVALLARR